MNQENIPLEIIIEHNYLDRQFILNLRDDMVQIEGNLENEMNDSLLSLLSEIAAIVNSEISEENDRNTSINIEPKKYSDVENNLESQNECVICLQNFEDSNEVYKLSCGHIYHKSCLDTWFTRQNSCPMCKKNIN